MALCDPIAIARANQTAGPSRSPSPGERHLAIRHARHRPCRPHHQSASRPFTESALVGAFSLNAAQFSGRRETCKGRIRRICLCVPHPDSSRCLMIQNPMGSSSAVTTHNTLYVGILTYRPTTGCSRKLRRDWDLHD